ncbi:hypothetical protein BLNAU_11708 [Blattamonas nauphoetae]|uniref:Uncharacterized protein n=1 Tax=Blattamonas nauphoetae TaxID=2049346 RepID=A0ABQ9XLY2_9EUKA|nr:hypothetical protein BLNAU_11708 [Blattamonas nauphoetae]
MNTPDLGSYQPLSSLSVVGSDLRMESQTLHFGTGPLLSFGLNQPSQHGLLASSALQMNTFLQFCFLVNMSSQNNQPTHLPSHSRFGSNVEQKVIGCAISNSTNHQHGTTMMDPNLGGSLACVNTSFTLCVRHSTPNEEKSESFKEFGQGDRFRVDSVSPLTSITFFLCTFKEMTCDLNGAALQIGAPNSPLNVTQCFFHLCTVTDPQNSGAAISVSYSSVYTHLHFPVDITRSSFTNCSTPNSTGEHAGALYCARSSLITMEHCFFETCSSANGGAAYVWKSVVALSNCAFVSCTSLTGGGGLMVNEITSMTFSSLQFRECVCTKLSSSRDIYFNNTATDVANSNTIVFCDSTSGSPNVYFKSDGTADITLVPQLTPDMKTDISLLDVSMDGNKATITIRTTSAINGTMGILLEGSNVPRLVHVPFGTASSTSTIGTVEVSKGDYGVLPILTDGQTYSLRSVSIPGYSLAVLLPAKVMSAESECANGMCTTINIVFRGQDFLTDLTFLLFLDGIDEPIPFLCETQTSATISSLRIGIGYDLTHSTTYTLISIVENAVTDPHQILCDGVTFTTPPIPLLSTVHVWSRNGNDTLNCGNVFDPCKTMEHAFARLGDSKSTLLLHGTFNHVSVWEIPFSSLVLSHNRGFDELGSTTTHSTIRVGADGGFIVDGATATRFESLSFILPSLSTVEVYAEIKTGLLTIMNCMVTGDVSTSSSLSARHPSFVRTRNVIDLLRLTTTQLEHLSVATLSARQSVGLTQILKLEAESVHTQSTAGSAAFFTLSNASSLDLSSSSLTSCSSSNTNCLGGGVSFSLSGSASLVIQFCSFVSCSVGDGGRGGGVGLAFSSDSSNNYLLDTLTFAHNTATFGRDLFILAESLDKCVTINHFLFNLHPPGFDRSNALFGSDRVVYVEETDLFPFLFPNNRYKNVFIDSVDETGQASTSMECGRESHPCLSLHDAMDHLLNADSEEELSQCVLERSLVLIGDFVFGEEGDVELCGYVSVGQPAGLVLCIIPIRTHKRTQTDPVQFGRVRFDQSGSIGCRLSFGLSEIVPPQTVLMKHLEFVLPLSSTHPQPIIAVQSMSLSLIDCVVKSIDTTQAVSSLLSFHTSLTSMSESIRLRVSHLVAQNLILSQPLISIKSSADLPLLMDSLSTGHSSMLSQTLPFSLPPSLSIEDSFFDCVSLRIDATHENVIETGSVLFADLSFPLSELLIRDCSFSSCSTVIISLPIESDLLSSLACGVCCFSLARSHLTLIDLSFMNCSFLLDASYVVPPSPSLLALTSHALAVRFLPSQNISQLASPLSAASIDSPLMAKIQSADLANPSFLFDNSLRQSPLASALELVGVEMDAGSSLDPAHPLPLALFVSEHCTPSLSAHSCVFRFDTADPVNVGLAVVHERGGAWPAQRNLLFVNCTSSQREES